MNRPALHTLYLIPWHIGFVGDLSFHAVALVRRLSVFLVEEAKVSREQFQTLLKLDLRGRKLLTLPVRPNPPFVDRVLALLARQDVGLVSSGGMPCFRDPGGWLVREVRAHGGKIVVLPGASALTTVLAASGFDWLEDPPTRRFSFVFFEERGSHRHFQEAVSRRHEPVVVFLQVRAFPKCLKAMKAHVGIRRIALFFDMARPERYFRHANDVRILRVDEWENSLATLNWSEVSDIALMIHPEPDGSEGPGSWDPRRD